MIHGRTPLDGIRVVEASSYVSAPFAAMMLGDLGADVIKIEAPEKGDGYRHHGLKHGGLSAVFANVNRSKRSVVLDLKDDEQRAVLLRLLGTADVFLHNWRPGVAESLGLDRRVLAGACPRLIDVAVSGYGTSGPLVDTPAFDGILQARSGFAHVHARDSRPTGVRDYIADKVTALFTVQAVLAALIARERTGEAQTVDVPMLDSFCYFNFPELAQDRTFLESDVRLGEPRTPIVRTRDGFLGVVPASGAQVARALDAVEAPEAENELRAAPDPIQLNNTLYRVLESRTVEQPTAFWLERFSLFDVPVGPVLDFDEHFTDAQVLHNGVYAVDHHPHGGAHRVVRHPVRLGGERLPLGRRAPALGEHRDEVLSELALPAD